MNNNGKPKFDWSKMPNLLVGGNLCPECNSPYITDWIVNVYPTNHRDNEEHEIEWLHEIRWVCLRCGAEWRSEHWLTNN